LTFGIQVSELISAIVKETVKSVEADIKTVVFIKTLSQRGYLLQSTGICTVLRELRGKEGMRIDGLQSRDNSVTLEWIPQLLEAEYINTALLWPGEEIYGGIESLVLVFADKDL